VTERDRVNVRPLPVRDPGDDSAASGQEPWVGLTEAGRMTGRHPDALRAMIRRGKLQGRKNNAGQWLVQIPPGMLAESDSADDPDMAGVVAELRDELLEARVAGARAEAERDSAVGNLADARATIERERARADRLEAALAEARRPWLARVLEGLRRR
jgi:hypothetical protein